jgi:hypothetical protein
LLLQVEGGGERFQFTPLRRTTPSVEIMIQSLAMWSSMCIATQISEMLVHFLMYCMHKAILLHR